MVSDGPYGYQQVNVTSQRRDPHSLLVWFERTLHTRRECEEIGTGDHEMLDVGPPHVLVHRVTGDSGALGSCTTSPTGPARSRSACSPTSPAGR